MKTNHYLSLLIATLSFSQAWAQEGAISGRVTQPTQKPVSEAKVVLLQPADSTKRLTSQTDTAGRFLFRGLEQGPAYRIRVAKANFQAREVEVAPLRAQADVGTVTLSPVASAATAPAVRPDTVRPANATLPSNTPVLPADTSRQAGTATPAVRDTLPPTARPATQPVPTTPPTQATTEPGVNGTELRGRVTDKNDGSVLFGVTVLLINASDSTKRSGTTTDAEGRFAFPNLSRGSYRLRLSNIGYNTEQIQVRPFNNVLDLGTLPLSSNSRNLKEVTVKGMQERVEQKADTLIYNADAYKVTKDANVEDLVTKMPGITMENGTIKAQGQDVKRVLVDGREFLGMMLRSL
ncbi:hypothetical protein BWI93_19405 [Siphonobacter sp. BAB-5385]|uniref:carboxypeptidase regulatory-like domain-containing protein n=1 Tax=Siphonobacter sp. BAB-5385 TaxID=1864822 RepID=UPI000B9E894E|nr:carboxypeptidase regulatory-like domain-containing protein [Siphonobacter sp. BAB-5385]OZI06547.1 hypothetical protein BWI93_19405 [Siphonobacter sp. BAB-5385]